MEDTPTNEIFPDHKQAVSALWRTHSANALANAVAPGSAVYHYTTIDGAAGIIRSQRIWATNILFMNDPRELLNTTDVVHAHIGRMRQATPKDPAWELLQAVIRKWLEPLDQGQPSSLFIASFTGDFDQPFHWAQYAHSNAGVAIGFDVVEMADACLKRDTPLLKCVYEPAGPKVMVEGALNVAHVLLQQAAGRIADRDKLFEYAGSLIAYIGDVMGQLVPIYKQIALAHENEWRVSHMVMGPGAWQNSVKHRVQSGLLKPYIELDLRPELEPGRAGLLPIRSITFGPTANSELLKRGFLSQLQAAGYETARIKVGPSRLQLRPST